MLRLIAGVFLLPLIISAIALVQHQRISGWLLVNAEAYLLIAWSSILLHELGHAAAARTVGLRVPRIEISIGRRLGRLRWAATTIVVNSIPIWGATYLAADDTRWIRSRMWISTLAGPLATLGIVVAAWVAGPIERSEILIPTKAFAGKLAIREIILCHNIWLLAFNLLPLPTARSNGVLGNDGFGLVSIPFLKKQIIAEIPNIPVVFDADDLAEKHDYAGAERLLEDAVRRCPESWVLRSALAAGLLNTEKLLEARNAFVALLDEDLPVSNLKWILQNNIAWADFRLRMDEHERAV